MIKSYTEVFEYSLMTGRSVSAMISANDPIKINKTIVKNRLTMAPTVKFDYAGADGKVTGKHIEHYRKRAEHGCGLICVQPDTCLYCTTQIEEQHNSASGYHSNRQECHCRGNRIEL